MTTKQFGKYDTNLCADSVEFCPSLGFRDICVCSTYNLDTTSKEKSGDAQFYSVTCNRNKKGDDDDIKKEDNNITGEWITLQNSGGIKDIAFNNGFIYALGAGGNSDGLVYRKSTYDPNSAWIDIGIGRFKSITFSSLSRLIL